jgi:hypothetical protein
VALELVALDVGVDPGLGGAEGDELGQAAGAEGAQGADGIDRLEEVRLALAVVAGDDVEALAGNQLERLEVAEAAQLEPSDLQAVVPRFRSASA